MAVARMEESAEFAALDSQVAGMLAQMTPNHAPSVQAALRTTIVLGESSRLPALRSWIATRRRGRSDRVRNPTVSSSELQALARIHPDARKIFPEPEYDGTPQPARIADENIIATVVHMLEETSGDLLHRPDDRFKQNALAQVFACRDEDWIVPFGYAALRAYGATLSPKLLQHLARYSAHPAGHGGKGGVEAPLDMVSAMRLADEASDLAAFVGLILNECSPAAPPTAELRFLLDTRSRWSDRIAALIRIDDESAPAGHVADSDHPPQPGPIIHPDDLQKGRWGGRAERDGRAVRAVLESVEREVFYFSVVVESTDRSVLQPPVVFHLHDSYPRSVVQVRQVNPQGQAKLSDWNAYGVFTIGVQVRNSMGNWISLELDLAKLAGLPKHFLDR
jgi:hypothetical protein